MSSRLAVATSVAFICLSAVFTGCNVSSHAPEKMALSTNALASNNGIASNGIASNGIASNGIASNGIASNGIASNGIASNGIASNGIASNGIASNGIASNGIASNGIASNGIASNGLAPGAGTNGLAAVGLTPAGLATPEFQAWFALSPAYSDMVMRYVARCALPDGQTLGYDFDDGTSQAHYDWAGVLGVAPRWAAGEPIPAEEQELVSACLAAHTNGLGQHVQISVRGYLGDGSTTIATTPEELADWTYAEGCFMGNLFDGTGVGNGVEPDLSDASISTPRGCAYEFGQLGDCAPMVHLGRCADFCDKGADGQTYSVCHAAQMVDGVRVPRDFRPVQVFLAEPSVYRCGDGICQSLTETADNCPADCAPAPVCGDGRCDASESAESCAADCAPADALLPQVQ